MQSLFANSNDGISIDKNEEIYKISTGLMEVVKNKICDKHGITRDFFDNMDYGPKRRQYIDDISIIVINLKDQY